MDQILKSEILLDVLAKAIAVGNDKKAVQFYNEYQKLYKKITGKNFQTTFEELKKIRKQEML